MQEFEGAPCIFYFVDGHVFRGVLDTGSPFLTVPKNSGPTWGCFDEGYAESGTFDTSSWGCIGLRGHGDSGLPDTYEVYAADEGKVEWKKGLVQIGDFSDRATGKELYQQAGIIFGLLPDTIARTAGGGGVFIGLIKFKEDDIRPTFLGQTNFRSLRFNFPGNQFQLSTKSMISRKATAIKLADLRPFGDPVFHYAVKSSAVKVNGRNIKVDEGPTNQIYIIFDTGCTGLILSQDLYFPAYRNTKKFREPFFGNVEVEIPAENGHIVTLSAQRPITTYVDVPWPNFKRQGHLVVVGLSFFKDKVMTVDVDDGRMQLEV